MADRTDNPTALAALRAASETIDDLMSVVDELHHAPCVHRRHAVWASASGSGHMLRQARRVRHRLADTIVRLQRQAESPAGQRTTKVPEQHRRPHAS